MDPAEVRRRNLISADAFPWTTATGAVYDSGDYQTALDLALEAGAYREARAEQARRRERGGPKQLGIGVAMYVEVAGGGEHLGEYGAVEVTRDGGAVVRAGSAAAGEGDGDSDGDDNRLAAEVDVEDGALTFPSGAYLAVVEVDLDTGQVRLQRLVGVDDAGNIINPLLAEGQLHGSIAQGVAAALYEEFRYDEAANPLSGTLQVYGPPTAADLPAFDLVELVTPSPRNDLGVKGIGEAGCIGAPPAVLSAVVDALAPLGVRHLDMPATPERVWRAIQAARQ